MYRQRKGDQKMFNWDQMRNAERKVKIVDMYIHDTDVGSPFNERTLRIADEDGNLYCINATESGNTSNIIKIKKIKGEK